MISITIQFHLTMYRFGTMTQVRMIAHWLEKSFMHIFFAKFKTFPIRFYRSRTLRWHESSQPRLASVQWSVQDVNYDNFIIITRYQDIWRSYHPIINLLNNVPIWKKINDVIFEKSWVFEDSDFYVGYLIEKRLGQSYLVKNANNNSILKFKFASPSTSLYFDNLKWYHANTFRPNVKLEKKYLNWSIHSYTSK